ncbi:hypothetical protein [Paraburkholderia sp.]|uniref:hypothetical protein n=1 Tax=Paraburkholderia sp. TaxID=1926495 RepID=UPI0025E2DDE4|nr:hypothetical protein [Paraburkholderia sp.]
MKSSGDTRRHRHADVRFSSYVYLAQVGIKFDFLTGKDLAESIGNTVKLNTAVPGSIGAIDSLNEINNFLVAYKGLTGAAAGLAAQRELFAHVHDTPGRARLRRQLVWRCTQRRARPSSPA